MSWIQENKFTSALAGVTLVGSAALIYLSVQKSGDAKDFRNNTKKMEATELKLQQSVPFPNAENREVKQENVRAFHDAAVKLQDKLLAYRPESMEDFPTTQFGPMLNKYRESLNTAFEESKGKVPDNTFYGFEEYTAKQPFEQATGELKYQLEAFQWLFSQLASAGDVELTKVVRSKIEAEKPGSNDRRNGREAKDDSVYEAQTLEIAFRGTEAQAQKVLESIANSEKYFFAIRTIRVLNDKTEAPTKADAQVAAAQPADPADGGFGGFDAAGDGGFFAPAEGDGEEGAADGAAAADATPEPAQPAAMDDTRDLMPILGDEKVNVYLQMELLVFKPKSDVKIPGKGGSAADNEE
ncbi:hypothetical protein SAMN02745181_2343 [Rubritalea squalenifaciens DSM 18772]|uniref:Uncharacterized protein n=1 Tax=Rubritalea squalenifaciens DSM 18772 TaxID=1123071 RepID=A0A1M6LAN8_9BACT|nr:Amuc_1100 family pilus-like protein [Rubritalea squalenifaciens]SHJ68270.1 hypothetical protein SAMN02745181_2343 [Rubritalea squalenifaciens DSM 18772]